MPEPLSPCPVHHEYDTCAWLAAQSDPQPGDTLPAGAIEACLTAMGAWYRTAIPADVMQRGVEAAAPALYAKGAAAALAKVAAVISPEQFRKLADWFDADDEFKEAMFPETWSPRSRQDEVQRDLRAVADLLDGGTDGQ